MAGTTGGAAHGRLRGRVGLGAGAAAAVLALSACGGGGESLEDVELQAGEGGMMPPVAPAGEEGTTTVDVDGVSMEVPEDWEVQNEGGELCLTPPGQPACAYGSLQLLTGAADQHPQNWPLEGEDFAADDGWASNTDSCRSLNTAASGNIDVEGAELTNPGEFFVHADDLKSHHAVWDVSCVNGDSFEVRMWFLPVSDVLLYVWSADPQHDEVYARAAESMDTTAHGD